MENTGKLRDFYSLGRILGKGSFGEVRICIHEATKEKRALKTIKKNQWRMMNCSEEKFIC